MSELPFVTPPPGACAAPAALAPTAYDPSVATDALALVAAAVAESERAATRDARLRALLGGMQALGFGRVLLEVRDGAMECVATLPLAASAEQERAMADVRVLAHVWRRWLRLLGRRAGEVGCGDGYWVDLAGAWARAEFGLALGAPVPAAVYVLPVAGADGRPCATLLLEGARAEPPDVPLRLAVGLLARQVAHVVERAALATLAERRAERLQRLQEAGAALGRSLDADEVVRELARQVPRLVPHDGLVVAHPELETGVVRTAIRVVHGLARPRAEQPLGHGPIAQVARTGDGVRVDVYDPACSPLAAADDLVGDGGPAGSALAVPMRVGKRLLGVLAVHAVAPGAFGAEDEELLRTVAAHAATAIANARLYAESEAERRQGEALAAVARAVGGSLRQGEVMRLVLRHAVGLLRAEGAVVALERGGWLHVVAGVGCAELMAGAHVPGGSGLLGEALRAEAPLIENAIVPGALAAPIADVARVDRAVLVPLTTAQGRIGVLAVVNRGEEFGAADARTLARLAEQVSLAILNARLFEAVETATREWKAAVDAITSGLAVLDADGRVVRCNARAAELLLGRPAPKEILGATFASALTGTPEPAVPLLAADEGAAGEAGDAPEGAGPGGVGAFVQRVLRGAAPERRVVRVDARAFDLAGAPHPAGGAVVTFDDVTAQHVLAARHRESEARYERLVEAATDAIFTFDAQGRITSANRAFERAATRPRVQLLGVHCGLLADPRDRDVVVALVDETLAGARVRRELRWRDRRGRERIASVITAPVAEGADGTVHGGLAVVRDVTEERRLGARFLEREKLAAVGQLVGGIAHELNNPLAGVLAMSELLLAEPALAPAGGPLGADGAELRTLVAHIEREARRAAATVRRLLDFSRQRQAQRGPVELNQVVLDVVDLRRPALRAAGVDLALALDYELPPVWGDAQELHQVVLAAVTNAEQALAEHGGTRRLRLRTERDAERVVVSVVDTGPGLSAEVVARAFEPFFTTRPAGEGHGLGLAVALGIVRAHGGRIDLRPTPGGGATCVVALPIAAAVAPD